VSLTVLSRDQRHRAIVVPTDDGATITYERAYARGDGLFWAVDHVACARLPFHAALDMAHAILRAPRLGGRL
jgi:hypothetical protein